MFSSSRKHFTSTSLALSEDDNINTLHQTALSGRKFLIFFPYVHDDDDIHTLSSNDEESGTGYNIKKHKMIANF